MGRSKANRSCETVVFFSFSLYSLPRACPAKSPSSGSCQSSKPARPRGRACRRVSVYLQTARQTDAHSASRQGTRGSLAKGHDSLGRWSNVAPLRQPSECRANRSTIRPHREQDIPRAAQGVADALAERRGGVCSQKRSSQSRGNSQRAASFLGTAWWMLRLDSDCCTHARASGQNTECHRSQAPPPQPQRGCSAPPSQLDPRVGT